MTLQWLGVAAGLFCLTAAAFNFRPPRAGQAHSDVQRRLLLVGTGCTSASFSAASLDMAESAQQGLLLVGGIGLAVLLYAFYRGDRPTG